MFAVRSGHIRRSVWLGDVFGVRERLLRRLRVAKCTSRCERMPAVCAGQVLDVQHWQHTRAVRSVRCRFVLQLVRCVAVHAVLHGLLCGHRGSVVVHRLRCGHVSRLDRLGSVQELHCRHGSKCDRLCGVHDLSERLVCGQRGCLGLCRVRCRHGQPGVWADRLSRVQLGHVQQHRRSVGVPGVRCGQFHHGSLQRSHCV